MKAALAVALAALHFAPAALAEPEIGPDQPGIWGFPYGELKSADPSVLFVDRDVISCLAEPILIEPQANGYRLSVYTIDLAALAQDRIRYYLRIQSSCAYDQASRLETCRTDFGAPNSGPYWTYYKPIDATTGIYQAQMLDSEAEAEQLRQTGLVPESAWAFYIFYCSKQEGPRFEFLQAAVAAEAEAQAAFDAINANVDRCGEPLCGADAERLRQLAGHREDP
jgi:hypothetical protein